MNEYSQVRSPNIDKSRILLYSLYSLYSSHSLPPRLVKATDHMPLYPPPPPPPTHHSFTSTPPHCFGQHRLPTASDAALVGARANPNSVAAPLRVIDGENLMPGCWFYFNASGSFAIYNAIANVTTAKGLITSGTLPVVPSPGEK